MMTVGSEMRTCGKHGQYEARVIEALGRVITNTRCPRCEDDAAKAADRYALAEAEEAKKRRVEALMRRASIPTRFKDKTFWNYEANEAGQERALKIARAYADAWDRVLAKGTSLIFSGAPGTGKTHLACAIANRVIANGASAVYSTVSDALRSIRRAYEPGSGLSEGDAINALADPALLVLDEVGTDYGTDHSKVLLFDVLNKRYEQVRPTIILTNLDRDALAGHLGERIMDRLREGGGMMVSFGWASYRVGQPDIA